MLLWNETIRMEKKAEIIFELYEDWKTSGGWTSWLAANQASEGTTYNNSKTAAFFYYNSAHPINIWQRVHNGYGSEFKAKHILFDSHSFVVHFWYISYHISSKIYIQNESLVSGDLQNDRLWNFRLGSCDFFLRTCKSLSMHTVLWYTFEILLVILAKTDVQRLKAYSLKIYRIPYLL